MSKQRAMEPEGQKSRAVEPEGHKARVGGDGGDDVEGHVMASRATEPEGFVRSRNAGGPDDFSRSRLSRSREDSGEDDTEGHNLLSNPLLGQQLARAREQEIQRSLRAREAREEASRPHKK